MKRLIIAQIKIELDSDKSDYAAANMKTDWRKMVIDHLGTTYTLVGNYCSLEIDETKGENENGR
jgi:hypothetical protein